MNRRTLRAGLVCAFLAVASGASAQVAPVPEDPSETARFRWGPIRFTPTLEISNFGRDSNVFNEAEDPKSDFTAAVGPAVRMWMRPFGSRLSLRTGGQYLFFKKYDDQRGWNTENEGLWELPLARLTPFVGGSYVNTRNRQGFEIDSRSRRLDRGVTAGTELRVSGKTSFILDFRSVDVEYDERETFLGAELASALNRREDAYGLQMRYAVTPLTTFVVAAEVGRDRFDTSVIRDTDSLKVMPGFELKPAALISGNVFVGFRRFDPLSPRLPDYSGVIASVKAVYVRSSTRFDVVADRDLAYSFEDAEPYYALLNTGLTVTQRVTQRWDVVAQGSLQRLAYRRLEDEAPSLGVPAASPAQDRIDRGAEFGGGVGFRVNETVRLGLNVIRATRRSSVVGRREFEANRIFGSITYGIQQ